MVPDIAVNLIERILPYKVRQRIRATSMSGGNANRWESKSLYHDVKTIICRDDPFIIDCGSNHGDLTERFNRQYVRPKIVSFEANPDLAAEQQERFSAFTNIAVMNRAIGQDNRPIHFNISNDVNSSSLLIPSHLSRQYHGHKLDIAQTVQVNMVRLDDVIDQQQTVDLIKLDLEGYELEAFKGAESVLRRTRVIVVEVQFSPLFQGAPLFSDIDRFLRDRGFRLLSLYDLYVHQDMQMTAGDALFLNTRYFGPDGTRDHRRITDRHGCQ